MLNISNKEREKMKAEIKFLKKSKQNNFLTLESGSQFVSVTDNRVNDSLPASAVSS